MTKIQRNAKPTYPGVSPSRARKNDVEDDSGALELPCLSRCDDASELLQFKFDKNMVQRQNDRRRTTPKLCGGQITTSREQARSAWENDVEKERLGTPAFTIEKGKV